MVRVKTGTFVHYSKILLNNECVNYDFKTVYENNILHLRIKRFMRFYAL